MGHIGQLEKRAIVLLCAGPALLRPFPGAEPGRAAHLSDGAPDLRLARDVAEAELPGHIPRHGKQTASGVVHRLVHHPATVQAHAPAPGRDTRSKGETARSGDAAGRCVSGGRSWEQASPCPQNLDKSAANGHNWPLPDVMKG